MMLRIDVSVLCEREKKMHSHAAAPAASSTMRQATPCPSRTPPFYDHTASASATALTIIPGLIRTDVYECGHSCCCFCFANRSFVHIVRAHDHTILCSLCVHVFHTETHEIRAACILIRLSLTSEMRLQFF